MQDLKSTIKQVLIETLDNLNMNQVIYYGSVTHTDDPLNLGRVRITPKDWVVGSYKSAYDISEKDYWTSKDPFVFLPLLPIFLYQVPKKDEWCHVIFYNNSYTDRNKYYIQGGFSSINNIFTEEFNSSTKNSALGERNKPTQNLSQNGFIKNPENKDLYPDPTTIGLLGRYNSDILLPENGYVSRVNKFGSSPDTNPTFNKRHSFSMIQNYKTRKVNNGKSVYFENNEIVENLQYVIEYNVYGGLGSLNGLFSGYINVYKISPYNPVRTSTINEKKYTEVSETSKIGPIYRKDFTFESFETICEGFREVIDLMNNSKLEVNNRYIEQPFPFLFQPEKTLYDKYNPGVTITNSNPTEENATAFIKNVYLNKLNTSNGIGLVSQKNTLGKTKQLVKTEFENISELPENITYSIDASDIKILLSHESQAIPGLNKIDFQDATWSGNTLDRDFIFNTILPNTNSMVRGEKLLELLELIVKFLINHVHPYHGMAPDSTSIDGTTTSDLLGKIFDAYNSVLNQNLRIN